MDLETLHELALSVCSETLSLAPATTMRNSPIA
jgi:hypothetical protein